MFFNPNVTTDTDSFSALQRAEIAEMFLPNARVLKVTCFSALQRAEIAEIVAGAAFETASPGFSALQRAEIAEIAGGLPDSRRLDDVSVLFNEPKLLKFRRCLSPTSTRACFSALQRAEIAEICGCDCFASADA